MMGKTWNTQRFLVGTLEEQEAGRAGINWSLGEKNDEFQFGVKQQGKAFSCGFHCDCQIIMLVSILHNLIHTKTNSNVRSIKCSSGRPALIVAC